MNKTRFITGASSGFGLWLRPCWPRATTWCSLPAAPAPLQAIAAGHGERALALQLDVTDPARAAALKKTVEAFGRIDVLPTSPAPVLTGRWKNSPPHRSAPRWS